MVTVSKPLTRSVYSLRISLTNSMTTRTPSGLSDAGLEECTARGRRHRSEWSTVGDLGEIGRHILYVLTTDNRYSVLQHWMLALFLLVTQ